jgi:hypothetical protein
MRCGQKSEPMKQLNETRQIQNPVNKKMTGDTFPGRWFE